MRVHPDLPYIAVDRAHNEVVEWVLQNNIHPISAYRIVSRGILSGRKQVLEMLVRRFGSNVLHEKENGTLFCATAAESIQSLSAQMTVWQ